MYWVQSFSCVARLKPLASLSTSTKRLNLCSAEKSHYLRSTIRRRGSCLGQRINRRPKHRSTSLQSWSAAKRNIRESGAYMVNCRERTPELRQDVSWILKSRREEVHH